MSMTSLAPSLWQRSSSYMAWVMRSYLTLLTILHRISTAPMSRVPHPTPPLLLLASIANLTALTTSTNAPSFSAALPMQYVGEPSPSPKAIPPLLAASMSSFGSPSPSKVASKQSRAVEPSVYVPEARRMMALAVRRSQPSSAHRPLCHRHHFRRQHPPCRRRRLLRTSRNPLHLRRRLRLRRQ